MEELSQVGGYFAGAVQPPWALAAFLFVYVAFLLQRQALNLQKDQFDFEQQQQREEAQEQKRELEHQRQQFKIQNDNIKLQNFESSFFQLLGNHNQIVLAMRDFDYKKGGPAGEQLATGRDCFKRWYQSLQNEMWGYEVARGDDGGEVFKKFPKDSIEKYVAFYDAHQGELGHYFRHLYHVIKFINEHEALKHADSKIEYETRRRYTSLVRATLSQFELGLLFYNCVSSFGNELFKPMVIKFGLLKNFDTDSLLKLEDENFYEDRKAFE